MILSILRAPIIVPSDLVIASAGIEISFSLRGVIAITTDYDCGMLLVVRTTQGLLLVWLTGYGTLSNLLSSYPDLTPARAGGVREYTRVPQIPI